MFSIFKSTLQEALSKKTLVIMGDIAVFYLILWGLIAIGFMNSFAGFRPEDILMPSFLVVQVGFFFSSIIVTLFTVTLGAGVISTDLQSGLALTLLARPIRRYEYVLGKLAGFGAMACLFASAIFFILILMGALIGLPAIASLALWQIVQGWLLFILIPVSVLVVTLSLSLYLKTVSNGIVMIFLYLLGLIGGFLDFLGEALYTKSVSAVGIFMGLLSPFQALYSRMDSVVTPPEGLDNSMANGADVISSLFNGPLMYLYIAVYVMAFLLITIRVFNREDIT
jgi:ABC-type transport system involved in multi-copper enzyme maturation permease subunit